MEALRCARCGEPFEDAEDRHCHDCNAWFHVACHEAHAESEPMPSLGDLGAYARHFWRHIPKS